jgi:hypothetical protein
MKGKDLLVATLKKEYDIDIYIGYLVYSFPSGIHAINVELGKDLEARDVYIQFDLLKLFQKKISIDSFFMKRGRLIFDSYKIKNGAVLRMSDVTLRARNFMWPLEPVKTHFKLRSGKSEISGLFKDRLFVSDGWIDIVSKDMEARGIVYSSKKDTMLSCDMISKNNVMKVTGDIKLNEFVKGVDISNAGTGFINDMLPKIISSLDGDVDLKFSFDTTMNNPYKDISPITFSGNISKE